MLPQTLPNGKLVLYEVWKKEPSGEVYRLFTERGYEWVFDRPLLLEYRLEHGGYPTNPEALVQRFFESMTGATFKNYPRDLFR